MKRIWRFISGLFQMRLDTSKRIYGLDILRALAILFVVIGHGIKILPPGNFVRNISMYLDFDGVSVFFVLSGFLIGGILIKIVENNKANFKTLWNFWLRRWLRTLPNYFFVLILLVFILPLLFTGNIEDSLWAKFKYALFIQNFYTEHPYFFPEAWSLSIEEWFYLLIPIFIFILIGLCKIKPKWSILIVSVSILCFVTFFRYYRFMDLPELSKKEWDLLFRKQVITRLDSLMFGIIGSYLAFYFKATWVKHKKVLLVLGVLIFCLEKYMHHFMGHIGYGFYMSVFSFSVVSLATLMVIPFLSEYKTGRGYLFKVFTIISLISYSMYLINLTVVQEYLLTLFPEDLKRLSYLRYLSFWAIVIYGSILMYKYVEQPFMRLRNRITK
ncbi:MAG: acyltransferase [Bacteroidia bacterium]|nr:acyltransferase [Bacteroidia bacterium]NND52324.1 acyltransferase [Flavobacteriaceae bacterium]